MSNIKNTNYSLLSQNEIDALVSFLMEQKSNLEASVMNQSSIDRLIQMLRQDGNHIQRILFDPMAHIDESFLRDMGFCEGGQSCKITVQVDEEKQQLLLFLHNEENGKSLQITPGMITPGDGDSWGRCISPVIFVRLVMVLSVQCSRETYDMVCSQYAKCIFGDESYKIPVVYLPDNESLLQVLQ